MSSVTTYIFAFLVGGAFCLIAQILIDKTALTPARILVLYVVSGVVLGALGWYDTIKDIAGCGATVPLTGFGANIADGVKKAVADVVAMAKRYNQPELRNHYCCHECPIGQIVHPRSRRIIFVKFNFK